MKKFCPVQENTLYKNESECTYQMKGIGIQSGHVTFASEVNKGHIHYLLMLVSCFSLQTLSYFWLLSLC